MINVTKTFLPSFEEYSTILKKAWDKGWITNHGELATELENKLKDKLQVNHLLFCCNGTIVLQMALKAFDITKEVITTPFSYVATTNAILWEGCKPIFVDIDPDTFCIDANKIEAAITKDTQAIFATHVYGLPCNIEKIQAIAHKYNLKVIYDGAHAFGCEYKGKSLLSYGDLSTCSFHATKIFHTVEGGCIICHDDEMDQKLFLYRSFGHIGDNHYSVGINAKNSEFHAAMGLAIFPQIQNIIEYRKNIFELYNQHLQVLDGIRVLNHHIDGFTYNYSYYPVVFESEKILLKVRDVLLQNNISTRRYFYPSLNLLPQLGANKVNCPISEDLSCRVLCLPFYPELEKENVARIVQIIKTVLQ